MGLRCAMGAQNGVGLVELRDQEGGLCASERGGRPTLGLAALLGVSAILMPRSWGLAMSSSGGQKAAIYVGP